MRKVLTLPTLALLFNSKGAIGLYGSERARGMTDRTGEFQGAVKVFRATILSSTTTANGAPLPGPPSSLDDAFGPPPPPPRPEKSEFFQLASSVAVGFEGTAKLIERLKKLVGRKGFSNNPAAEINDVMKLFEADMAGLQRDIATLQRHAEGNSRGSPPLNSQQQKHCQHLVAALRNTAQEHTKAFRDALLLRAAVEKQQTDRQRIFSHSRGVAPATQLDYPLFGGNNSSGGGLRSRPSRRRGEPQPPSFPAPSPTLPRPSGSVNANPNQSSATTAMPRPGPGGSGGGLEGGGSSLMAKTKSPFGSGSVGARSVVNARSSGCSTGRGRDSGLEGPLPPTEPYRAGNGAFGLRKRAGRDDGMDGEEEARRAAWQVQVQEDARNRVEESHKVEKMIGDLGQMFSRFSTMVAAQEEVVIHIEDDVEAAHAFAAEGQANLARYYQIMSGNRGIIIKVFILLIVFIWFFLKVMR